jgi:hypothetical protein
MQFFPDNTVAHYKTKLSERICENGNYEVALTELIYPLNYYNFITKEPLIASYTPPYVETPRVRFPRSQDEERIMWEMKSGFFSDEKELTKYMSSEFAKICGNDKPLFSYDVESKKIKFKFFDYSPKKYTVQPNELENKYREYSTEMREENGEIVNFLFGDSDGPNIRFNEAFYEQILTGPFDLFAGQRLMYVYSDIVSPYLVGDVKVPLLRVVTPKGKRDEMSNVSFTNPYYLPVARHGFDTIEININNELGEPMSFTGGKSVAILHFRKRNEPFLSYAAIG